MDTYKTTCKLFDKIVSESVFNLNCECKRCNKPVCNNCEVYKQKIEHFGITTKGKKDRSICFQCITCDMGR